MEWPYLRDPISALSHLLWMILAIPATILLVWRTRGDLPKQISLLIYGLTLIACFGSSALFHSLRLPWDELEIFARLDHMSIFLLIAGSCTGIAFSMLRGRWKWIILGANWFAAAAGITCLALDLRLPRWVDVSIYLAMGWGLGCCYPRLAIAVPHRALRLVWIGGMFYSVGAILYLIRWPNFWPGVFGFHELWHLFVMAGATAHFFFVLKQVVPFPRISVVDEPLSELCPVAPEA